MVKRINHGTVFAEGLRLSGISLVDYGLGDAGEDVEGVGDWEDGGVDMDDEELPSPRQTPAPAQSMFLFESGISIDFRRGLEIFL